MESVTVRIKDRRKSKFIKNLLREFDFVEIVKEKKQKPESHLKQRLREGFNAIRLHEEGKIKLKSGKEILNEL